MSAKLATLGLLKINGFWNTGYDVIISVHDFTSKIISRDSNYVVDGVMWPKFVNSNICRRKVIIKHWKTTFLRGGLCSSSIILD